MKRFGILCCVVLVVVVALPVTGGDHHKCTASTQDCLDKMKAKLGGKPWLGIEMGETDSGHWKVTRVIEGSPAERAGFAAGDVLIALNGIEMSESNKQALKKAKHALAPGSEATYVVKRQGGKVTLKVEFGTVPPEMVAQWIGEHMMEQHSQVKLASR